MDKHKDLITAVREGRYVDITIKVALDELTLTSSGIEVRGIPTREKSITVDGKGTIIEHLLRLDRPKMAEQPAFVTYRNAIVSEFDPATDTIYLEPTDTCNGEHIEVEIPVKDVVSIDLGKMHNTYIATLKCSNCGWENDIRIPRESQTHRYIAKTSKVCVNCKMPLVVDWVDPTFRGLFGHLRTRKNG